MSYAIIVHISNEDPVLCDVEQLPDPSDQFVLVSNPRRRDGKDIHYLEDDVATMIIPWHRINFVQILPSTETDEVITFIRE
ncbi:MAG: hypothetical protein WAM60_22815 [Candidatus Promineifilaceae bacterium]